MSWPRPKCGPQRKSTGCGVVDRLLGELHVAGDDPQVVFRAGAACQSLRIVIGPLSLPAHQPADLRLVEVERLVELEHRAVGRLRG